MTKWFHSGRRRDLCALLYEHGELRAQSLKSRLESHYDERIDPGSFYGTLSALVEAGHLRRRTEGIADVYALTEAGEAALLDHYAWLGERIAGGDSEGTGGGGDRPEREAERGGPDLKD
ncbi:helix-turn-helix transcriptional regulator [Halorubrum ezzemoulense]|jgi:DNA-binding PadR family transcriptional regulator|uniref:Helix-turn-helix transcriptional regulator n=2 Tax=Halorubrum ezzemoulense TaxID=337243 RepID=A0A256JD67_HALEZ|nr:MULTISPECIES: helix-turn-helix transcriptional regulator [Halorubrum]MDB2237688.1 helix-turn-helix transcriptional regulator [Halorubrum ezzemoulense]MDB2240718.1 helix-turn-helix transcriptional regulator [Halorubrum ezzemoulense]MDB2243408.1 helix-turn-helix transcriptional regulator [Halorubrum ezzemoulense]MDB2248818.1 helix-turn-helix transcriptional regulator [Halorubrum ezzemoulense]MDB2251474.1 helix-turn-helix transcriptional regulator [Halorubrum ezzemoulense]